MKRTLKRKPMLLLVIILFLSSMVYINKAKNNEEDIVYLNKEDISINKENDTVAINYEVQKKTSVNTLLEFVAEHYDSIKNNPLYENKNISFQFKDKYSRVFNLGTVIYKYSDTTNDREMINSLFEVDWSKRPNAEQFKIANILNDVYNENKSNLNYTRKQLYKDVSLKLNKNIIDVMDAGTKVSNWEWENLMNK